MQECVSFKFLEKCWYENYKEKGEYLDPNCDKTIAMEKFKEERENPNNYYFYIYRNNDAIGYFRVSMDIEEKAKNYVDYLITDFYITPKERGYNFARKAIKSIIKKGKYSYGFVIPDENRKMRRIVKNAAEDLDKKLIQSSGQYPEYSSSKLYIINNRG